MIDPLRTIDPAGREDFPIGETIKVGILQPSEHFESFTKGARLAAAEINSNGGILGAKVELIEKDTAYIVDDLFLPATHERPSVVNKGYFDQVINLHPDSSTNTDPVQVAKDLFEKAGVVAILDPIYPIGYDTAVELAPVLRLSPLMQTTVDPSYYSPNDLVFPVADSNMLQGKLLADFAVKVLDAKWVAGVYQVGDMYSKGLVSAAMAEFSNHGGGNVANGTYYLGDTDFANPLSRIYRGNPDVIIVSGFGEETALFIQAARDFGIETPILGDNATGTPGLFDILKDKENTYYVTNFIEEWTFAAAYASAYTSMFGNRPDGTAAAGYDVLYLLKAALETARSTDSVDMREALYNLTNFRAATWIYHYNLFRHPAKRAGIVDVSGKYKPAYATIEPSSVDFRHPGASWHVQIIDQVWRDENIQVPE